MGFLDFIPVIGDVIKSATSAANTASTNKANLEAVRLTNENQMKLAEYQYEKNLEQWHRENAYNDPSAQLQRLANAGLNPHLVYDKGSAIQPSAASPQYDAPNLQSYHQDASPIGSLGSGLADAANNAVSRFMDNELKKAQIELLGAQTDKAANESAKTYQEWLRLSDWYNLDELQKRGGIELTNSNREYAEQLIRQGVFNLTTDRKYREKHLEAEIDNILADTALKGMNKELSQAQRDLAKKNLALVAAQIRQADAAANASNASAFAFRQRGMADAWDNLLRSQGINPSDPVWMRVIGRSLQDPEYAKNLVKNLGTIFGWSDEESKSKLGDIVNWAVPAIGLTRLATGK